MKSVKLRLFSACISFICRNLLDCRLGWDVTDFGRGDFRRQGLLLFTIRNGINNSEKYSKPYAEKIMISRAGQVTLMHCHETKCEDIINRGGGKLIFELYHRKANTTELAGRRKTVPYAGRKHYSAPQSVP